MWRGWISGLALLCLMTVTASAQQYHFHNYTGEDGLSQLAVQAAFQDRDGYVWIGTQAGLDCFDGHHFEVFGVRQGLANDWINALAQDRDGRIWAGTNNGLSSWTAEHGFTNYNRPDGLPDKQVFALAAVPTGGVWLGTGDGLAYWDGNTFKTFTTEQGAPAGRIYSLLIDHAGRLWVGAVEGLFYYDDDRFHAVEAVAGERVYKLAEDRRHHLWVGVEERVEVFDGARSVAVYDAESGLTGLPARAIHAAQDGVVWVGTIEGLALIEGGHVQMITVDNGLPFVSVSTLLEDREGILWVGAFGGIAKFLGRAFTNYTEKDGLASRNVRPIVRDHQGDLWVGSHRGVNRFDGVSWETFNEQDGLSSAYTRTLHVDREGVLWIGTIQGLNYFDGEGFRHVADFKPKGNIVSLAEDRDGRLWVAAQHDGIYRRGPDGFEHVEVPGQSFFNARLLVDRRGDVWASGDHGLSRWDGIAWVTFTTEHGLAANEPYFMAEDHLGKLWFGYHSSHGITVYDGSTFTTYTTDDGLINDAVYSVGVDQHNNIWIGTARGVDRYDGKTFVNYGPPEGYASHESNAGGFFADDDGTLWFGTTDGLSHYDPRFDLSLGAPPALKIHRLHLGGIAERIGAAISVAYARRDLDAVVAVLSYINSKKISLRYRLIGYDEAWRSLEGREIHYTNLPAGKYRLDVQARKHQAPWSSSTTVSFQIENPFWKTWWFALLVVVAFSALAGGLYKYRVYKVQARNRLLAGLVRERTAELRAQKTHLEETLDELTIVKNDLETANTQLVEASRLKSEFLANMSHEIRTPMNGVIGMTELLLDTPLSETQREFVDSVNRCGDALVTIINDILDFSKIEAGKLELEVIDFDLRQVVEDVVEFFAPRAETKGLELMGWIEEAVPEVRGDPHRLRQILTNLLSNAFKFTEEGEVVVEVALKGEKDRASQLQFSVRDTGIGIAPENRSRLFQSFSQVDGSTTRKYGGTGLGLAITKQLVEMMSGSIDVDSVLGEGSTFFFTVWLKQAEAQRPIPNHAALAGKRVLIVDDNETNRIIMERQTSAWGMVPTLAEDGHEALRLLGESTAEGRRYDLVILDYMMPGMDGYDLARAIKADPALASIPLVFLTSYSQRSRRVLEREPGLAASLTKPVRQSQLFELLVKVLGDVAPPPEPPKRAAMEDDHAPVRLQRAGRILVVEDNVVNQKVASRLLQKIGYVCDVVGNGREALDVLEEKAYTLVLMDVQMPEMDGFEATQAIRARENGGRRLPIVAMTANAMDGERQRCLEHGMDEYISKPFKTQELQDVLERLIAEGHEEAAWGPPSGDGASLPPGEIDLSILKSLRSLVEEETQYREMINLFLDDTPRRLAAMQRALVTADGAALEQAAHQLKGSCGSFGALGMVRLCMDIETLARLGPLSKAEDRLHDLEQEYQRVRMVLKSED